MKEKVWVIEDPDEERERRKTKRITDEAPPPDGKSPAAAYSLSMVFWGGGQIYNGQRGKGLLFLFLMLLFYAGAVLSGVYWKSLLQFLHSHDIFLTDVFITAELLLFFALAFWTYNAGDAYHTAAKGRARPFTGVKNRVFPFLCSLLIPGWGQFLNGQPVKGSIFSGFSIVSLFSLLSIPSILMVWPLFDAAEARFIIEGIFTITVLFAPLIPFIWLFGSFDALKVSLDDLKKESFFARIKYANNRRRTQGWVRGVFPHIKSTVVLGLFLILLSIVIYRYFPEKYYSDLLTTVQARLHEQGMTIVPELIGRLLSVIVPSGK